MMQAALVPQSRPSPSELDEPGVTLVYETLAVFGDGSRIAGRPHDRQQWSQRHRVAGRELPDSLTDRRSLGGVTGFPPSSENGVELLQGELGERNGALVLVSRRRSSQMVDGVVEATEQRRPEPEVVVDGADHHDARVEHGPLSGEGPEHVVEDLTSVPVAAHDG